MKIQTLNRKWSSSLRSLCLVSALAVSTAGAAVVWDFNPNNQQAPVGSSSQVFTSEGAQITARGYNNNGGTGTAAELFFKNRPMDGGAVEVGLGLANSPHNELNVGPANFIQLDLRSILGQGFTNGQISVASLQNGEGFQLFGSNTEGLLGTSISGAFAGLAFDDKFVAIPNFGDFQFISVIAASGNVLPSAFSAEITPVPEMGALMPIVGLFVAVASTKILRRRRSAQLALED